MKIFYKIFLTALMPVLLFPQYTSPKDFAGLELKLIKRTEVDGRQGVCVDNGYYYVSCSKELFKYSRDGKLISKNLLPFKDIKIELNHFGDIDLYQGKIYSGLEYFKDGAGLNISVGIYDASDLSLNKLIPVDSASGQKEVSGIAVDAVNGAFWLSDWTDGGTLYKYDLLTGRYLSKITLEPKIMFQQGILSFGNYLFVTADDGDAENNTSDNLYAVDKNSTLAANAKPILIKKFIDVIKEGEIEGLTYDRYADELLVLFNRGARIIKGMPKGFYPGYEKEIHEIYHYKIQQVNK